MNEKTLERCARLGLIASVLVELIAYYLSGHTIADHDSLVMGEVARRVLEGEKLYREAWDNKPPLALLFYAPSQLVAPMSYMGMQLFGALWTILQALLTFILLRGESALVRNITTSLVLLLPLSRIDFIWVSSEDCVNLFVLVMVLIGYRIARRGCWLGWEAAAVGAFALAAFHCRQTGLLFAAPALLGIVVAHRNVGEKVQGLAQVTAGAVVGFALTMAIVLMTTDLSAYGEAMFINPQRYASTDLGHWYWTLREQLILARQHPYFPMILLAVLVATDKRDRWLVSLVAALTVVTVLVPAKHFGHYQEQAIPLLVLGVLITVRSLEGFSPIAAGAYGFALVLFYLGNGLITGHLLRDDLGEMADLDEVVRSVETENAKTPGTLLAIGPNSAYVYFRTRVKPVDPKYHWELFFDAPEIVPISADAIVDSIIAKPPTWLVVDHNTLAAHSRAPGGTRTGRLVHSLCGAARVCTALTTTARWTVLRLP